MLVSLGRTLPYFCSLPSLPAGKGNSGSSSGSGGSESSGDALRAPPKAFRSSRISSTSNPFVKHCVKLRLSSSYRRSCGAVVVVGLTPILEICRFQEVKEDEPPIVDCLVLLDGSGTPKGLHDSSAPVVHVSSNVMKKLSGMQSIESIEGIALMRIPTSFCEMDIIQEEAIYQKLLPSPHRVLVLEGIQDPGNLGTLLRSAMAFKWDGVFLLPGCCDPFNEKALRAARGASFQLPLVTGDWLHLKALKTRFQMNMLAGHPENCDAMKRSSSLSRDLADSLAGTPLCLVLGSEGSGLSEQTMKSCELISIPMAGKFESLNVSVAGGIFLYMLQPQDQR